MKEMFNYENVSFINKLPEEPHDADFLKLVDLKNSIDLRLKSLENKIKIGNFAKKTADEETKTQHIRACVYFSPSGKMI